MHKWVEFESSLKEWKRFSLEIKIFWCLKIKTKQKPSRTGGGSKGEKTECDAEVAHGASVDAAHQGFLRLCLSH